ncbi:hypothetical protein, variant 1 [Aphanomyces astaci]|uniref:RING-type domain-containing protein n=1 Tax=Aphanomyces astaci TaxID=112090 RepID=W4GY91_APHAT|nr:hypothetical protein, variant 1 [Aphanomyces astaci]ETV84301.1 hypothetical protein, variant 1 [Aphanomyces astaci]|eukprot:XP_009825993.1 hypothetical protein, variant 1 [Aphanomyces astaci]
MHPNDGGDLLSTVRGAHMATDSTGYDKMNESLSLSPSTHLHVHQQAAMAWMLDRETNGNEVLRGGILADGPGLGKTLTMLSVIQVRKSTQPTLVVVPNQIIAQQWLKDMSTHFAPSTWSASMFNASAPIDPSHRIVIILMKDLTKEWHRRQSELSERGRSVSILYHVTWGRICVDEVQEILGKSSLAAQMMHQLQSPIRWGLSGTPVSKVADIAGVAHFLQLAPYDSSQWWRQQGPAALLLIQPVLDQIVWRTSSGHVSHSLQLPTQTILPTTYVELSAIEFAAYRPHFERYIHDIRKRMASFEDNAAHLSLAELKQLLHHPAVLSLCKGASHVSLLTKSPVPMSDFAASMASRQREQCSAALSQWLETCPCDSLCGAYMTWRHHSAEIPIPWQVQLKVLARLKHQVHFTDSRVRFRHQIHRTILDSPRHQRRVPAILWQRIFAYLKEDFSDQLARVVDTQLKPLQAAFEELSAAFWTAHGASWSLEAFQSRVLASYELERRIHELPAMRSLLNEFTNMRLAEAKTRVGIVERPTLWHYLRNNTTASVDAGEIRMVTTDLLGQFTDQYSASLQLLHDLMQANWTHDLPRVLLAFGQCNHATRRLDRTLVVGREERWQRRDAAHGQGRGQTLSLGARCVVCALRNRIDMALSFLVTEGKSPTLMVLFFTRGAPPEIPGLFRDCTARLEHMLSLATLLDNWLRNCCDVQACMAPVTPFSRSSRRVALAYDKFRLANCYRQYTNTAISMLGAPPELASCDLCGHGTSRGDVSLLLCCHRFCPTCIATKSEKTTACLLCHKPMPFDVSKAPPLPPPGLACGSKMDALLGDLEKVCPRHKCVVFSQFSEVLDLVLAQLTLRGVRCVQLRSGNQVELRREFETQDDVRVLLLPLKKYNHGLNLVEATHVFLVEPSLQPALHAQAMARVKRLDQTEPTFVHRYVMRGTVEEAVEAAVSHQPNQRLRKMDMFRIFAQDVFKSTSCADSSNDYQ